VSLQGLPIEGGGFKGRTNKLVDGCYSWWVGGLFPLLEEVIGVSKASPTTLGDSEDWSDDDGSLYNRQALQSFVLVSSQQQTGGLRDKPGKPADAYHTLYNLSGLSSAQHRIHRPVEHCREVEQKWITPPTQPVAISAPTANDSVRLELRRRAFVTSIAWVEEEGVSRYVGGKTNRVNATHPVFDLTMTTTKNFMNYFYRQNC